MHLPHTTQTRQALTPLVLAIAIGSLLWYAVMLFNPANAGHPVAYGLLALAEAIGMFQLLGIWLTILLAPRPSVPYEVIAVRNALQRNPAHAGKVAVFVPVAGEPIDLIRETLTAARDIQFPHHTVVLDDGASDGVKEMAGQLGVEYLRRGDRRGWKAGNINHALEKVPCDYFAIFDADFVAKPAFLTETLPFLLADPQLAFVQTPQTYGNRDSFVGGGSAEAQDVFYRHIQPAKNAFNAAFCVGTNVLFRASAVRELGGMYQRSNSEDIWTSLLLHERGWKSLFLPTVLAVGQAPDTVNAFLRQQFRWARGGYELLLRRFPLFDRTLTLDQRLQYFHTSCFFLTGVSVAIFLALPLLYVYFGWAPLEIGGGAPEWIAHFLPYFVATYGSATHLIGRFPRWRTLVVGVGAFSAHISAALSVLLGVRFRWSASGVRHRFDYVRPVMLQMLVLLLSLGAIPVLFLSSLASRPASLLVAFWLLWNSALLFSLCRRMFPRRDQIHAEQPVSTSLLPA